MFDEELDLLPRAQVLLGPDPDRPDPVLAVDAELGRARPDAPVSRDHDQIALSHDRHPVQVQRSERNFRKILVPRVEHIVSTASPEELAKAQGVLIGEVHRPGARRHQAARSLPAINSKRIASST